MNESKDADLTERAYEVFGSRFPYAMFIVDSGLEVRWATPGCEQLLGFTPSEMLGRYVYDLVHRDDIEEILPMALSMLETAGSAIGNPSAAAATEIPLRILTASGDWAPMSITGRIFDDTGRMLCVLRPCAERLAVDSVLYEFANGSSLDVSLDAVIKLVCSQFSVCNAWIIAESRDGLTVRGPDWPSMLPSPASIMVALSDNLDCLPDEPVIVDSVDGELYWAMPVVSGEHGFLHGVIVVPLSRRSGPTAYDQLVLRRTANLASLAVARAKIDQMMELEASTDHLTGSLNRRAIEKQIAILSADPSSFPATVLFVDLNDFKRVNDCWGHGVGDSVLSLVTKRMSSVLRPGDHLGRLGGDEFAIVCRGLDRVGAEVIRRRLEVAVAEPMHIDDRMLSVSVSIGAAVAHNEAEVSDLLSRSDAEMYSRKRGRVLELSPVL